MSKELEWALEHLEFSDICESANKVIKQALTPPTEEDVCKTLSEYLGEEVRLDKDKSFYYNNWNFDRINYVTYYDIHEKVFSVDEQLPPHLITMIGRFYEAQIND